MSADSKNSYVTDEKLYSLIPVLFAAAYAESDGGDKALLLDNPSSLAEVFERESHASIRRSMSDLDKKVVSRFNTDWENTDWNNESPAHSDSMTYIDDTSLRYFVDTIKKQPITKYSQITDTLDREGYFNSLSLVHSRGLKALISMYGFSAMELHPWAGVTIDEEELTDLNGDYFFKEMSVAFSKLGIRSPEIDMHYADDGGLNMEVEGIERVIAKAAEAGNWFSYIATMNILNTLSEWLESNGRSEKVYSLWNGSVNAALILTPAQHSAINVLDTGIDEYEKPRIRSYSDVDR